MIEGMSLTGEWALLQAIQHQGAISVDMAYDDMTFHFTSDSVSVLQEVTTLHFDQRRDTTTSCYGTYPYHTSSSRSIIIDGETFDMIYSIPNLVLENNVWSIVLRKSDGTLKDIQ